MIEQWYYLFALIFSIGGLLIFDWRHKLAFFQDARRSGLTISIGMLIFLAWDFAGISLGIFFSGGSRYALDFMLLPNLPLEEIFFLFLLCYMTLLIYAGGQNGYRHIFNR